MTQSERSVQPDTAHDITSDLLATAALLVYSLVVAAGFARVFSGWEFFDNLIMIALVGHGVALGLRLARVPVWIAFPITLAALVWTIGAMFYRDTYSLLLPTSDTWSLFRLELEVVGNQFRSAVAPVAFLSGWDVLAAIGVAAAVLLADTFAFRAFARAEALVPGGVLFVFVAALGTDRSRVASTMALVAAGVVATVLLRHHHAPAQAATIGVRRSAAARAMPIALGSALSIALVAGFVGPRLPGAEAEALYDTTGNSGGNVTEVISPLVDIRSRLTNRSTTELFTVTADADSYWRSSALPRFDGRTWGLPERGLDRADGSIGQGTAGSIEIRQQIVIAALGGSLLPAAADPIAATGAGDLRENLRFNQDSATLVKTGDPLERGNTFDIVSASPRYDAATLSAATSNNPGDSIYFELPDDFPSSIAELTREVTSGAANTYEVARTLQDWMRNEFEYSLEIQEGHGSSEIEAFLRNRVGYCEQFAGTYAAMLRSIGIPARVAVGFTPGANDGTGRYSVLGRNAHAWPEVWFDDIGWVPFEPTPGRGAPNAQDYTGVPQQQDDGPLTEDEPPTAPTTAVPATTIVDQNGVPVPTTIPAAPTPAPDLGTPTPVPTAAGSDDGVTIPWRQLTVMALIALALAMPALVRRLRRAAISAPDARLEHLWHRATSALGDVGVRYQPDLTPVEAASATAASFPLAARPMHSLADVITEVAFAPDGDARLERSGVLGTSTLQSATSWCRQVEQAVADTVGPLGRVRRYFTVWS
ncbi:MAG: transglutaminaseTgpA domain-containing protein [Ilumatobacter sp.]